MFLLDVSTLRKSRAPGVGPGDTEKSMLGDISYFSAEGPRGMSLQALPNFVPIPKATLRVVTGSWAKDILGTKCMRMTVAVC